MAKEDWITLKVERDLVKEIDNFIRSPKCKEFGSRKYWNRPDFVRTALVRFLQEETGKKKVEVIAK